MTDWHFWVCDSMSRMFRLLFHQQVAERHDAQFVQQFSTRDRMAQERKQFCFVENVVVCFAVSVALNHVCL